MFKPNLNDNNFLQFIKNNTLIEINNNNNTSIIEYNILYNIPKYIPIKSKILVNRLPTKWRETYKVNLNIKKGTLFSIKDLLNKSINKINTDLTINCFKPGDSIGIIPINNSKEINEIINYFKLKSNEIISLKTKEIEFEGKIYDLLKQIELNSIPSKRLIKELYNLLIEETNSKINNNILLYLKFLLSKKGETYYMKLNEVKLFDFIKYFINNINININKYFLLLLKYSFKNKPRFFSIVNIINNTIELIISIEETNYGIGLISSLIKSFKGKGIQYIENQFIYRPSNLLYFNISSSLTLFICSGTGLAAFLFQIQNMKPTQFICLYAFRDNCDNLTSYFNLSDDIIKRFIFIKSPLRFQDILNFKDEKILLKNFISNINEISYVYLCGSKGVMRDVYNVIKNWQIVKKGNIFIDSWI